MATNYTLKRATIQDIPALSEILVSAMAKDALWTQMFRTLSHSEQVAWSNENTGCRFDPGEILGACETWRVVDSSGKPVAFGGIGLLALLSEEALSSTTSKWEFPPTRSEALSQAFCQKIEQGFIRHAVDRSTQFLCQTTMVHPLHQRKGLATMLTKKFNAMANDEELHPNSTGETYVRARPTVAGMLYRNGYEVMEKTDFDMKHYGGEGVSG